MKTRTKLENILLPIARPLNINPNILTLLSIILTLGSAYYILTFELIPAAVLFLFAALLDALDGLVAREHKRETKLGSFFDKTADRINDGAILLAIVLGGYIEPIIGLAAFFFIFLASYMSEAINSLSGKKIAEAISFRPIRSAVVFFGLLFNYVTVAVWVLLFIGLWTTIYRLFKAKWLL
jgi:phosphatidylglycerophosphate synthase